MQKSLARRDLLSAEWLKSRVRKRCTLSARIFSRVLLIFFDRLKTAVFAAWERVFARAQNVAAVREFLRIAYDERGRDAETP
jgi:hypothetical protein